MKMLNIVSFNVVFVLLLLKKRSDWSGIVDIGTGQGGVVVHEDKGVEGPGIRGDGEHEERQAAHEIDSDEEKDVESGEEEEEDQGPAANTKVFGMKRSNPAVKKCNDTYDYKQKYPEDAPYEEASPAARVWKTYEDESGKHHVEIVQESRDNLNVLLVFLSLFVVLPFFVIKPCSRRVSSQPL
ncbi:hypothetical protein EDD18DRAFT_1184718 [Armillaria luteobubalina]|uniref:Uncharacterized protein n=1 Tax=Armillaria luteobubalina TaxID=153913 RepID=A0AA39PWY3_9AGAR|nr:hypothetical protein EDD18DRAFT_1184718 [Armillaria luteobubalina]